MNKRMLIIDCQVFQTPAWDRGMGKYSLYLIKELYNTGKIQQQSTKLLFNSRIKIDNAVLDAITNACPDVEIVTLDLMVPKKDKIVKQKLYNQKSLTKYIGNYKKEYEVDFLILSLFLDQAVPAFPSGARKMLIFYDLIPLMYFRRYLGLSPAEKYLGHFKTLFEADILFTISETVANDLTSFLGIEPSKIVNINGASISRGAIEAKKPHIFPTKKYILMPSGGELRKNNHRAVQGFENFNRIKREYQLVLTSSFGEGTIEELKNISHDVVFTGNVSEAELKWLYDNCELVLFASEYEGLGLPILEAVEANKKVACSNIPVFRELSNTAFNYFDHMDPNNIASVIKNALSNTINTKDYKNVANKYTWSNSAKLMNRGFELDPRHKLTKRKIAVVAPYVGSNSITARTLSSMHQTLSSDNTVDYFFSYSDCKSTRPNYLRYVANSYDAVEFNAKIYQQYDEVIYHLSNEDCSVGVLKSALCYPGRLLIYDKNLNNAFKRLYKYGYISKARYELAKKDKDLKDLRSRHFSVMRYHAEGDFNYPTYKLPYSIPKQVSQAAEQAGIIINVLNDETLDTICPIIESFKSQNINPRIICFNSIENRIASFLMKFYDCAVYEQITEFDLEIHLGALDSLLVIGFKGSYKENEIVVHAANYNVKTETINDTSKEDTASEKIHKLLYADGYEEMTKHTLENSDTNKLVQKLLAGKSVPDLAKLLNSIITGDGSKEQLLNKLMELEDD